MRATLHFLRPCLRSRYRPLFVRFRLLDIKQRQTHVGSVENAVSQKKLSELNGSSTAAYPRILPSESAISCHDFVNQYRHLQRGETVDNKYFTIRGRIYSFRIAGSKLVFIDIVQNGHRLQAVCELSKLSATTVTREEFDGFRRALKRGDIISLRGYPHRTGRGELSLLLIELPQSLSPCLHQLPVGLHDQETRIRNRHVDFLVNPQSADRIRLRSEVISYVRQFLVNSQHIEVQTPILADAAGGAVAQPFETSSLEFPDRPMTLRIAPELWLKRLMLGGFDRVFEIGSCFRNEGIDLIHNPEFTTCEFYRAYADLEELMGTTEKLICGLSQHADGLIREIYKSLNPQVEMPKAPFHRLEFVPAIEAAINRSLPDLESPDVVSELRQIFHARDILVPNPPTLPRLLNKLSDNYLEPQCSAPTFIVHHPECLSPLSKSFTDPKTGRRVAARAELFINGQELANMYEEENSPFEQRRKFVEYLRYREAGDAESAVVDENYLQALEWGLPPTGGWGCGIDRLCMLLSGASRIGDVLAFGSLRNVVALGRTSSKEQTVDGDETVVQTTRKPQAR
ncbi:hypothetical protein MMC07_008632 [Pseudocyphellaria aurata]|nr:hypothetical protein [Pseudocyphellaria aurata]